MKPEKHVTVNGSFTFILEFSNRTAIFAFYCEYVARIFVPFV